MLGVMKCFSSIGAMIMLLVGLVISGITIYAWINQDVFLSDQNVKQTVLYSLITASATVLIISILGIVGVVRKNCFLIFLYQIFVIVFLAIFLALGIGTKILPDKIFDGDCTTSQNNPLISYGFQAYSLAELSLCKNNCQCDLRQASIGKYSIQDQLILRSRYTFSASGPVATQSCGAFSLWTPQQKSMADTLGKVQQFLQCSKWCDNGQSNLIYYFSDVNDGKPVDYCYPTLKNGFYKYSNVVGITCFVIALVFLTVLVCNICICCHPDNKKLEFRQRFIYQQNQPINQGYQRFR